MTRPPLPEFVSPSFRNTPPLNLGFYHPVECSDISLFEFGVSLKLSLFSFGVAIGHPMHPNLLKPWSYSSQYGMLYLCINSHTSSVVQSIIGFKINPLLCIQKRTISSSILSGSSFVLSFLSSTSIPLLFFRLRTLSSHLTPVILLSSIPLTYRLSKTYSIHRYQ